MGDRPMNADSPRDSASLPLSLLERIDDICDRFEGVWKAGSQPAVAEYLSEVHAEARPRLLCELLRVDIDYRRRHGEPPQPADYQAHASLPNAATLAELFAEPSDPAPGPAPPESQGRTGPYDGNPAPNTVLDRPAGETLPPSRTFGDYEILRELG